MTSAREYRHLALGQFDGDGHDAQMFFVCECGALSGRAAGNEKINPRFNLPLDQSSQRDFVKRTIAPKWSD
jgi:hypothetical protein